MDAVVLAQKWWGYGTGVTRGVTIELSLARCHLAE
jgi:hypothetical protein